ncbi:DUF7382 domain-containing protein [Halorhabdus rudnickae]|uniref:DUF7382 domain-containing protein n=1 Tax=Halorhabdus rudnickae TaxID=1775544 RepID=UPI001082A180|nr:carboxypeptidase regulatory-like domain-containing protein [Halorhabdus rudnickae]
MRGPPIPNGSDRSFKEDERAIEGLPIRLVIALVVGVAALGIMMQVLGTFDFGADKEVTVEYENPVVSENGDDLIISVVDSKGEAVKNSYVVVKGDTLSTEGVVSAHTGENDHTVQIAIGGGDDEITPQWRSNQDSGELTVTVKPPQDGNYVDDRGNPDPTIIRQN